MMLAHIITHWRFDQKGSDGDGSINYCLTVSSEENMDALMVIRRWESETQAEVKLALVVISVFRSAFISTSGLNHRLNSNQTVDTV